MHERLYAEISAGNLVYNFNKIKTLVPEGSKIVGTVKADAYGHGAVNAARILSEAGAGYLTVATLDAGAQLREAGIETPILILGVTPPAYAEEIRELGLTQTVTSLDYARALSDYLSGGRLRAHLKVDTGMSRLGISCAPGGPEEAKAALELKKLDFEGVFTHFAVSDEEGGEAATRAQYGRFMAFLDAVGFDFTIRHCNNSGGVLNYPEYSLDMVRPGIITYGYGDKQRRFRQVMTVKSTVSQVKELKAGDAVSYGGTFKAGGLMREAVVAIGYADGLMRALSGKLIFSINGHKAPQIGRICMDMCMADVSGVPEVRVGDEVIIFGENGFEDAETAAARCGTIPYELLCAVSKRVPRRLVK